jgi:hypothetical protein
MGSSTRPPKYSCRECWTGVNPMKNNQSKPDTRTIWGLKRSLTNKPKEERILDMVNRIVTRIQNDERNCLWPNTLTRHACVCPRHLKKTWPPYALNIKSMNQTSWDVPSLSSLRKWTTHQNLTHGICSSDASVTTFPWLCEYGYPYHTHILRI